MRWAALYRRPPILRGVSASQIRADHAANQARINARYGPALPSSFQLYCFARAASIAAMSIFRMVIIAAIARLAAARSGSVVAASRARGVICHEKPQWSLHQPHALSWPPLLTMVFHSRSVSA